MNIFDLIRSMTMAIVKVKSDWSNPENAFADISQQMGIVTENLCPQYGTTHTISIRKGFWFWADNAVLTVNRVCDNMSYQWSDLFNSIPRIGSYVTVTDVQIKTFGLD